MKVDFNKLNRAFSPKTLAVIGDSNRNEFQWLRAQSTFQGKLYSVQINTESIEGIKALGITNYTSIVDIPEPVDLAIISVPRTAVPRSWRIVFVRTWPHERPVGQPG